MSFIIKVGYNASKLFKDLEKEFYDKTHICGEVVKDPKSGNYYIEYLYKKPDDYRYIKISVDESRGLFWLIPTLYTVRLDIPFE